MAATSRYPVWILAHAQQAAHGRRGRPWAMPEGNFAATLMLFPEEPNDQIALRSFVAALALYDAFVALTGRAESFTLKWPNDVLLNGAKVAGILLERGATHLAIGIGINLAKAPDPAHLEADALPPVSLADETGARVTPEEFLDVLAAAYARWEAQFVTYGFEPIRTAWLARAARIGQPIRARIGTQEHHGTFDTVDKQGNLVLTTAKGTQTIAAADVYF